jgi:hypothetical protein
MLFSEAFQQLENTNRAASNPAIELRFQGRAKMATHRNPGN